MDFGSNFRQHRGNSTRFYGMYSIFSNLWEIFWMFRCSDVLVQNQTNLGIVQQTYKTLTRHLQGTFAGQARTPCLGTSKLNGTSEHRNITKFQDDITHFFCSNQKVKGVWRLISVKCLHICTNGWSEPKFLRNIHRNIPSEREFLCPWCLVDANRSHVPLCFDRSILVSREREELEGNDRMHVLASADSDGWNGCSP